jgi:hypothetical protein
VVVAALLASLALVAAEENMPGVVAHDEFGVMQQAVATTRLEL